MEKTPVSTSPWGRRLREERLRFPFRFSLRLQEGRLGLCYAAAFPGERPQQRFVRRTPGKPRPPTGFCHVGRGGAHTVGVGREGGGRAPHLRDFRLRQLPHRPEPRVWGREQTHLVGEVRHNEGRVGHAGFLEVLAAPVPVVQLLGPVLVRSFGDLQNHKTRGSVKRTKEAKS